MDDDKFEIETDESTSGQIWKKLDSFAYSSNILWLKAVKILISNLLLAHSQVYFILRSFYACL